ncbi:MAG: bestrophin family ion channel [Planctomycetota bacterium]|nr:bestrophin family ion channel [Planctomycetota bacterium]
MPLRDVLRPFASSRTLVHIGSLALLVGLYSILPVWKELSPYHNVGDIPSQFHAVLSLVLGALLVFRTNTAYARWWEARTLWGGLVNASRNLAIKLDCLASLAQTDSEFLRDRLVRFPRVLMEHLRRKPSPGISPRADAGSSDWDHRPSEIVHQIYAWVAKAKAAGTVDGDDLRVIDRDLALLLDVCGGCEKIARTPVVRSYRIFARQCIVLFLLSLPWGIAHDFGWWTVPLTIISAYFMLGMEIVAEHVEEPFGLDEDDLDLEGLCKTIEKSVDEIFF